MDPGGTYLPKKHFLKIRNIWVATTLKMTVPRHLRRVRLVQWKAHLKRLDRWLLLKGPWFDSWLVVGGEWVYYAILVSKMVVGDGGWLV